MFPSRQTAQRAAFRLVAWAVSILGAASLAHAQGAGAQGAGQAVQFHVSGPAQRLEMIVNTSRILTFDYDVPRLLVSNTDLVRATPLTANQIQLSGLKPGVTQLNIWDAQGNIHSLDVNIYGDARELYNLLASEFPEVSELKVRPAQSSIMISGYVPKPDTVNRIVRVAQDYYPNVINNMNVGGGQTVLLHVKVMEVSRTKLRRVGVDWAALMGNDFIITNVSGLISATATQAGVLTGAGDTVRFGILDNGNSFGGFLELLKQNNLAKLLAEPTLVTISGRPARFNSGGEVPVPVPAGLGVTSIQYREFGTAVDFVPIVLGNGMIRLEVRPQITEIDPSLAVAGAPGFRSRTVDTGVEMKAGQTLALAGLIQTRTDSEVRGIPWLSDLPWAGAAFRRTRETMNEVELLIMVTPELVDAMDPHEVPPCGPAQSSVSPTDVQLYWKGHVEVPGGCCDNCSGGELPPPVGSFGSDMQYEQVQPGTPAPTPSKGANSKGSGNGKSQFAGQGAARAGQGATAASQRSPARPSNAAAFRQAGGSGANGKTFSNPSDPGIRSARNNPAPSNADNYYAPSQADPAMIGPIGYDPIK